MCTNTQLTDLDKLLNRTNPDRQQRKNALDKGRWMGTRIASLTGKINAGALASDWRTNLYIERNNRSYWYVIAVLQTRFSYITFVNNKPF